MKQWILSLAIAGLGMTAIPSVHAAQASDEAKGRLATPVEVANGLLAGTPGKLDGVVAFKGIPFGAPPVGELRWKPPQPVSAWQGVRAADQFGPACLQPHQLQAHPETIGRWICPTRRP